MPFLMWHPLATLNSLLAWSMDSEEHWLLDCPGAAAGPRRDLLAFDLQLWKQPWNSPTPEKMPKWDLFQDHAFPEEYPGLKWPPEASPACELSKTSLLREVQAIQGSEKTV